MTINENLNRLVVRLARRAEMNEPDVLAKTFVKLEPIASGLQGVDRQIIYGRRGTGKTHAFKHLAAQLDATGETCQSMSTCDESDLISVCTQT